MATRGDKGRSRKPPRQPGRPASRDYMALANKMIQKGGSGRGGGTPVLPRLNPNNRVGTPSAPSRAARGVDRKGPKIQSRDPKQRMKEMMRGSDGPLSPEVHESSGNLADVTINKFRTLFESNRGAFKGMSWDDLLSYAPDPSNPADVEKAMVMAAKMSEKMRASDSTPGLSDGNSIINSGVLKNSKSSSNRSSTPAMDASRSKPARAATPLGGGGRANRILPDTVAASSKGRPVTPLVTSETNQNEMSSAAEPSKEPRRGHTSPQRSRPSKKGHRSSAYYSDDSDGNSNDGRRSESSYDTEEEEEYYRREEAKRRERRRRRQKEKERMRRSKEKRKLKEKRRKDREEQPALPAGMMGLEGTSPEKGRSRYGASQFSPERSPSPNKSPTRVIPIRDMGGNMKASFGGDNGRKKRVKGPSSVKSKSDKSLPWAKPGASNSTSQKYKATGSLNHSARKTRARPDYLRRG